MNSSANGRVDGSEPRRRIPSRRRMSTARPRALLLQQSAGCSRPTSTVVVGEDAGSFQGRSRVVLLPLGLACARRRRRAAIAGAAEHVAPRTVGGASGSVISKTRGAAGGPSAPRPAASQTSAASDLALHHLARRSATLITGAAVPSAGDQPRDAQHHRRSRGPAVGRAHAASPSAAVGFAGRERSVRRRPAPEQGTLRCGGAGAPAGARRLLARLATEHQNVSIVPVDYSANARRDVAARFFGCREVPTTNHYGGPFYSYFLRVAPVRARPGPAHGLRHAVWAAEARPGWTRH